MRWWKIERCEKKKERKEKTQNNDPQPNTKQDSNLSMRCCI